MIDQSLGKTHFVGKDGFNWWIGQVAPPKPWHKVNAYTTRKGLNTTESKFVLLDTILSTQKELNFLMRIYRGQM